MGSFGPWGHFKSHGVISNLEDTVKEVMKVCETKVLGLTVDEHLSLVSHSQNVYNKIQGKWAGICNYTNKHWGFNQKVLTQIA